MEANKHLFTHERISNAEEERLACLMEEAGEIVHVIGKILRHGYDQHHPERTTTNRDELTIELGDFFAAVGRMIDAGDVVHSQVICRALEKKKTASAWLRYQGED